MRERKYRLKARIMRGTTLIGYQMISPSTQIIEVDLAQAARLARNSMVNNVKLGSDGKLKSDGIRIGNLPIVHR